MRLTNFDHTISVPIPVVLGVVANLSVICKVARLMSDYLIECEGLSVTSEKSNPSHKCLLLDCRTQK